MNTAQLFNSSRNTLLELATEQGITASARSEAYGCVFGRDTAITVLKILNTLTTRPDPLLLARCRTAIQVLIGLQGTAVNFESGEEPGKCIHEYRPDRYEHLINRAKPWYLYPDKTLKNFDSIDSTPLFLLAIHRYWEVTGDAQFLLQSLSAVEAGLHWILEFADKDEDHLIEYELSATRIHGGLTVQSWTDSVDSLLRPDGSFPKYPIAAVEVQAIAWVALQKWVGFYESNSPSFALKLLTFANQMKAAFNRDFVYQENGRYFLAQALDGDKEKIITVTPNPLLCLWASIERNGTVESILDDHYMPHLVERAFLTDVFEPDAGLRTMSTLSPTFKPSIDSYHNGSFWPMLNGLIYEGLLKWRYYKQAELLKVATLHAIKHFNCPIELFIKTADGHFAEYVSSSGKKGCRYQAWTAATILEMTL